MRRGQGAIEYLLLLGGVLLIVIIAITLLRTGVLRTTNTQIAGSLETFIELTNGTAVIDPPDTEPPSVTLVSPASGSSIPAGTLFSFVPSDNDGLLNATLYANFTGAFTMNESTTSLTNGSTSSISANVSAGYYVWNVRVCDTSNLCSFAAANFTLTVLSSGTNVWNFTANPGAGSDELLALAYDGSGFLYATGFFLDFTNGVDRTRIQKINVTPTTPASVWTTTNGISFSTQGRSLALDTSSGHVYAGGDDNQFGFRSQMRLERYSTSSGSSLAVFQFDAGPPFNDAQIFGVAFDPAGAVITAGRAEPSNGDDGWRLQRVLTSTMFAPGANFTANLGTTGDIAYDVVYESSTGAVYSVGYDTNLPISWLLIRLSASVLTTQAWNLTIAPAGAASAGPLSVAVDNAGFVYVGGTDGAGVWHVKKVFSGNGTIAWNYSSDISGTGETLEDIAYHNGFVYTCGWDNSAASTQMRLEKLRASDGLNVMNYTSNPSSGNDRCKALAIDTTNGWVYLGGWDEIPGNQQWRIERVAG